MTFEEREEERTCLECDKLLVRTDGCPDLQWSLKAFCNGACKQRFVKKYGSRPANREWEPTEEQVAEIERRKAECRERGLAGLVYAGED